mmetsp:Transcript_9871/g.40450  ORF Transcript_9871/g.40450 Transcript_9871/m.40450 type:complete len:263 (+) Transcript_9871:1133-1921(+)
MYAPSLAGPSICSGCFLVTSVSTTVLSSGQSFFLAVVCITAVRNDCGLKRPESQTALGSCRSLHHCASCSTRRSRLFTHEPSERSDGYASFAQPEYTAPSASAIMSFSIGSDIVRSPLRPRSSSASERFISARSTFMRSASWMATMMYGVISSVRPRMSSMSNCSGSLSTKSSNTVFALSSTEEPSSPPPSLGWSERMAAQRLSASRILKPISALGWRPKARGVSVGKFSSMYAMVCFLFKPLGGEGKPGKNSIPSRSSSLK